MLAACKELKVHTVHQGQHGREKNKTYSHKSMTNVKTENFTLFCRVTLYKTDIWVFDVMFQVLFSIGLYEEFS